jgi:hypothetical protein
MNNVKITFLILIMAIAACKKPTENLKIVVDTNIIKYTALIQVTDAVNGSTTPANATLTIGGTNAADIYEISGKKQFKLINGIITIGPGPAAMPTTDKPASCTIQVTAPGYNAAAQTITFTADKKQQVINVYLVKTGSTATGTPTIKPLPVYDAVSLTFTGTCANKQDLEIRPSMYVFYRENASGDDYRYLGYMDKGDITTTALAKGKTYDFQLTYGGKNYTTTQQINQSGYNLKVDMGTACNSF